MNARLPVEQNQPGTYDQELGHRFAFHPADTEGKRQAHAAVRGECLDLATFIQTIVPKGREQSLAITKIEEAMMWANAGIARGGGPLG